MDRWPEFAARTLPLPSVVQHDFDGKEHLVWAATASGVVGPMSRTAYDEAAILADVAALQAPVVPVVAYTITNEDATVTRI